MRILVDGPSVRPGTRLEWALAGLSERGHEVGWVEGERQPARPASSAVRVTPGPAARLAQADLVVGGGRPLRSALLGWSARVLAMVLAPSGADLAAWGVVDRWAWGSLPALAVVEERDEGVARGGRHGIALEQFALWSASPPDRVDASHTDVEILERACERTLARSRGGHPTRPGPARSAAFVDRDGTLIAERGYLADPTELELLPGVVEAIRELQAAGHPVVVVSNQAGVGRGLFSLEQVHAVMAQLRRRLRAKGVELDAIHFCPHRPDEGCACRKPGTELLRRAADDLVLTLSRSVMVGDKRLDAATGQAAGGAGVLVRTGYGRDEEARIGDVEFPRAPDRVCDDLLEAARWFVAREERAAT